VYRKAGLKDPWHLVQWVQETARAITPEQKGDPTLMNQEIATLVRQEQPNDFIRETAHNPERTMTMNAKRRFFTSLIAFVLAFGTFVAVAPRGGTSWGAAPAPRPRRS
jgi:hypothetical protein